MTTVPIPRPLLEQVIRSLDGNLLERTGKDEFLPAPSHTCDEDCGDTFAHDGMWVTTFDPHPLAEALRQAVAGADSDTGGTS